MKLKIILIALLSLFLGGCAIHGYGGHHALYSSAPVIVTSPPARVFHGGRWLHYRNNAYCYSHNGVWVIATNVPSHVAHHHRPNHSDRTAQNNQNDQRRQRSNHSPRSRTRRHP